MPLLMIAIIFTVQFALVFLGNQAASASAREAARVGRVTDDPALARAKGESYAANLGQGVLEQVTVSVERVGDEEIRATVSGEAPRLLPFFAPPRVSEEVQGPIERFVQDGP
jgi:Flp pilus assembly protein TadG